MVWDYRWPLLIILAMILALTGDWAEFNQSLTNCAAAKLEYKTWNKLALLWDPIGADGEGVYTISRGVSLRQTSLMSEVSREASLPDPRLAVFTFRPLDLNRIDVETLQTVKGIGPKLAAAIVGFRRIRGPLQAVDELRAVKGIGPAKLGTLRQSLVVQVPRDDSTAPNESRNAH